MPEGRTLVVGQSGGGTAVINASLAGIVEAANASGRFDRILGLVHGVEGLLAGETVPLDSLTAADLDRLADTPSAALGSCRYKLRDEDLDPALDQLDRWRAAAFCYIGGDDSARTTARLAEAAQAANRPLTAIAVPKTIDNDLPEMDHTPGYGSAARALIAYVQDVAADALAMRRVEPVRIIETKGRDSGWLTLAAALARNPAGGWCTPHLLYLPERPLDANDFLAEVDAILTRRDHCVVVVAETVRDPAGNPVGAESDGGFVDAFGHRYTDGPAPHLARLVERRLRARARYDRPGAWLKTGGLLASPVDRCEARRVGRQAGDLAVSGSGDGTSPQPVMVTIERLPGAAYAIQTGAAPLQNVIGRVKTVPPAWQPDADHHVDPAFAAYLEPLLGGRLPAYFRLLG